MLAEGGRSGVDRPGDAAVPGEPGAADEVDRNAGAVRGILHRQAKLEVHGYAAEQLAFHAQEADLVVVLPRDIIGRTDMDVLRVELVLGDRLHRLGLADLLRLEPRA